jgi:hypothetical protein
MARIRRVTIIAPAPSPSIRWASRACAKLPLPKEEVPEEEVPEEEVPAAALRPTARTLAAMGFLADQGPDCSRATDLPVLHSGEGRTTRGALPACGRGLAGEVREGETLVSMANGMRTSCVGSSNVRVATRLVKLAVLVLFRFSHMAWPAAKLSAPRRCWRPHARASCPPPLPDEPPDG